MKRTGFITAILIERDLLPAPTGRGLRQWISYRLLSALLPTIGMYLFLLLVALGGLGITTQHHQLQTELEALRASPYNAIFAEGQFFRERERVRPEDRGHQLSSWKELSPDDLSGQARVDGEETPLFRAIYPLAWAHLELTLADGEDYPDQRGLALESQGSEADTSLLRELAKAQPKQDKTLEEQPMGMIISTKALKKYGYDKPPAKLRVKTRNAEQSIELAVRVAERLPYQIDYVLSMEQWRRLKTGYYDATISDFTLRLPAAQQEHLGGRQPLQSQVTYLRPYEEGDMVVRAGLLDTPMTRADILSAFQNWPVLRRGLDLGQHEEGKQPLLNGAVMHLNYSLLDREHIKPRAEQIVLGLREALSERQVKVHGGLLESVLQGLASQYGYQRNQKVFKTAFTALIILLFLFFAVVLHTRMHRIGVMRMLGVADKILIQACALEALLLWLAAFILAWLGFAVVQPLELTPTISPFPWAMFMKSFLSIEMSLLLPMILILRQLTPQEMISYRT